MSLDLVRGIEIHHVGTNTREWRVFGDQAPALQSFGIANTGISNAVQGFHFERHNWDGSQVMICHGGQGEVSMHGKWVSCSKGMAYLTPAGVPHAYRAVGDKRWELSWVIYGPSQEFSPLRHLEAPKLVRADPRLLSSAVTGLYLEFTERGESVLMENWSQLIHLYACRAAHPDNEDDRLWKVWDAVSRDLKHNWTVSEMAKLASTSPETLRRLCLKYVKRSPIEQVTTMRMNRAAGLLRSTQSTIETIADTVGYRDRFSFSTAFKRTMGNSPYKFRKERERL